MIENAKDLETIKETLHSTDWNFASSKPGLLDSIHPYPAKFIVDIPRTLIHTLKVPSGTYVFDPFCGSGTTLSVAQQMGHSSVGVDLNPIACLISRVRTTEIPDRIDDLCDKIVDGATKGYRPISMNIPNIDHWFRPEIQYAVAAIESEISLQKDSVIRDILNLALSSILVRVSNQDSDTRYAAVSKNITAEKTYSLFISAYKKIVKALHARNWTLYPAKIFQANTLELSADDLPPIGLVVTSPPYPNAYEYWLYHKYRMWWLGYDPLKVKENEIGARAHFFSGSSKREKEKFPSQMAQVFSLLKKVIVPGGYICFVIGRSKIHGEYVDNAKIIENISVANGFDFITRIDREILPTRKSFNLSHAQIKQESILIMRG